MITLNRDAPDTLYQQLFNYFKERIVSGEMKPGCRLPASRVLADDLQISRASVVNAYDALESAGLVVSRVRRGLFVVDKLPVLYTEWMLSDGDFIPSTVAAQSTAQEHQAFISFSTGSLPIDFMPVEAMRRAINTILDRDAGAALGYEPTEGHKPLRRAIADQLHSRGMSVTADQILVTGGCQQAIDLAVQSLVPPNGILFTTDPTYVGLIDIARTRNLELITIPWSERGIDLNMLENIIQERHPHLFYLMTTFLNPTGAVLSMPQRRQLLALTAHYKIPILEDGVYDGFDYEETPLQSLCALDDSGLVLYASGFSKTVVPGTRIGYLISSKQLHKRISRVKQAADVCTPGLNQRAMTELLRSGLLINHLEKVRHACKIRRDALLAALNRFADGVWHWNTPSGGLYVWIEIPSTGPTAADLHQKAAQLGVDFAIGNSFSPDAAWPYHLRVNFTSYPPPVLEEGIHRLWTAWQSFAL
ncbi:MAG: aminotransferase class I/II-fold pyridoxal phosphate-dependent enzyme [Anaerolineaceae bacterium]|nr:aminotransferase class I/II-fold pyridoxal phosphate-dependent enzyme [Anaerolineaceae bacterium]